MANNQNNSTHRRRNHVTRMRLDGQIDSVVRLTRALQRDVGRLTGQTIIEANRPVYNNEDKLEFVTRNLIEIRDTLEAYNRPNTATTQPHTVPQQPNPQPMPYHYPFMPRYMF